MCCGMLAFQSAGVPINSYTAYEIDKYAIQTTKHNFPEVEECGDVFTADFTQYKDIDYLIGGSPCTYWSIAQSSDKRETTASGMGWELFSQYVRALRTVKPKYFIYENNKSMSQAIRDSITKEFGFDAVCINSALVSAQNRQRLYWVGKRNDDGTYSKVNVEQPEDRGIILKDILCGFTDKEKGRAIIGSIGRTTTREYFKKHQGTMAYEPVGDNNEGKAFCLTSRYYKGFGNNPGRSLEKHRDSMVAEPVNTTPNGKSQTVKAQCQKTSIANICCYSSTYGASGVAEPVNTTADGKAQCIRATCYKDTTRNLVGNNVDRRTAIAEPVKGLAQRGRYNEDGVAEQTFEARDDDKSNCVTTVNKDCLLAIDVEYQGYAEPCEWDENGIPMKAISSADGKTYTVYKIENGQITIKDKSYPIKLKDGYYIIRKLTVTECKRLQTIPEWYEFPVSDSQAYKMIGNGWTIEVIAHLIKSTL